MWIRKPDSQNRRTRTSVQSLLCVALITIFMLAMPAISNATTVAAENNINQPLDRAQYSTGEIELTSYATLPSISATLRKYNERRANDATDYWVQLSPMGLRVRDVEGDSEVIKNFEEQLVWLVNTKKKTSFEIDIDFYRQHFPSQVRYLTGAASISNLLGVEPCDDLEGTKRGKRIWRGQIVQEWDCLSVEGVPFSTQLFSQRWGIVIRVRHSDLSVEELVDIREETSLINSFTPDEALHSIQISEFLSGKKPLVLFSQ